MNIETLWQQTKRLQRTLTCLPYKKYMGNSPNRIIAKSLHYVKAQQKDT